MIVLYDLFEGEQRVYVGITSRPDRRFREHKANGTVAQSGRMVVVADYKARSAAEAAERARIKLHNPPRNRMKPADRPSPADVRRRIEEARNDAYATLWKRTHESFDAFFRPLCHGRTVREIVGLVKSKYNITVSHGAVQNYLKPKPPKSTAKS